MGQRAAINLAQAYAAWREADRATYDHRLRWKTVADTEYLYSLRRGSDTGRSLGRRSPETEAQFARAHAQEDQVKHGGKRLLLLVRMYKAAHLSMIPTFAGNVLRALDRRDLLGNALQVVGTNALPAYELEAGMQVDQDLHATEDFDLTWIGKAMDPPPALLEVIREADATWTVSMERDFQIVNKSLEIIDVLVASSNQDNFPTQSPWRAISAPGQEDLLGGTPVDQVVADFSGKPARIVAPDPRRFALHKFLLSQEPTRKAIKRVKDRQQAEQVMTLVQQGMPHYPMDQAFLATLSDRLRQAWGVWEPLRQASEEKTINEAGRARPKGKRSP